MNKPTENTNASDLQQKLKSIGFEQTEFEPKIGKRFIATLTGIPSHVIKSVTLPVYSNSSGPDGWKNSKLDLTLYNPLASQLEQKILKVLANPTNTIIVNELNPVGTIDTTWTIEVGAGRVEFGTLDWSSTGNPNIVTITFTVLNVEISY